MKFRRLGGTGLDVSILSFGASSLGGVYQEIDEQAGVRTVHEAIDRGVNLVDVSPYYGITKAETVLGKAIGQMDRSRFLLSTKAGRYGADQFDFSADRIVRSVEESLARLQTDYIDILFLHDIEFGSLQQIVEESIPAIDELKRSGVIRFTGISGLPLPVMRRVLDQAHVDCLLSYCHYSLNDNSLLELLPYLQEKGTGLVNASPLSMGLLSGHRPPDWHPAGERLRRRCAEAANYCRELGTQLPKLAIQYSVANEHVPTTLVSAADPAIMAQNIQWASEPIDGKLLADVLAFLEPIHNETWPSGRPENQL